MRCDITHYDEPGDSTPDTNSENWIGNHGNTLTTHSCALNSLSRQGLGIPPGRHGTILRVTFSDRLELIVTDDDTAPETDQPRLDLFNPFGIYPLPGQPQYADVEIVFPPPPGPA